jgi:polyhydroxyalkanoate synthesis repressor PhaR
MSEPRLIKKYPNRRLYDTELSRYITIDDIRGLIAARTQPRIIEQRSGRDITRSVLLQVIAEQELGSAARLTENFLAELIRSYDQAPAAATAAHLEGSLREYLSGGETRRAEAR